ncbi:hypothetical protein ACFIOY_19470 [Bradyrhizobium sp. TZ2]
MDFHPLITLSTLPSAGNTWLQPLALRADAIAVPNEDMSRVMRSPHGLLQEALPMRFSVIPQGARCPSQHEEVNWIAETEFADADHVFKAEQLLSFSLSLEVTRGQFRTC